MRRSTAWILALLVGGAQAQLYKSYDENGNVVYSDVPPSPSAAPLELPPVNVIEVTPLAPRADAASPPGPPAAAAAVSYTIAILQPTAEETIRNQPTQRVQIDLQPPLQPGHLVTVSIDGTLRSRGTSLQPVLNNVERGTHQLTAAVVDAGGKPIVTSAPVTVHVFRQTVRRDGN